MAATRYPFPLNNSKADLGTPSDFGSAAPRPSTSPFDEEDDDGTSSPDQTPEALHYHDEEQRCDGCDHFGRGNQCSVLNMPVSPEGGCDAFRGTDAQDEDDINPAAQRFEDEDADYTPSGDYGV